MPRIYPPLKIFFFIDNFCLVGAYPPPQLYPSYILKDFKKAFTMNEALYEEAKQKAQAWLGDDVDKETQQEVRKLLQSKDKEAKEALVEGFTRPMVFGTGGLRARMGVGLGRMNPYSVGWATQGLCHYLLGQPQTNQAQRAVVGYDNRLNSEALAAAACKVLSNNGIEVYCFERLRPTPLLCFGVRYLKACCGIMITASHNPKEYNGYKVYDARGAQLSAPADSHVMEAINNLRGLSAIKWKSNPQEIAQIHTLGEDLDEAYMASALESLRRVGIKTDGQKRHLRAVYTPLHGTGITILPTFMKRLGYDEEHIQVVAAQATPDGHFSAAPSANPEEKAAFDLAITQAKEIKAHIVLATDPDADRIGMALPLTKDFKTYQHLSGNQCAVLLLDFLLHMAKKCSRGKELPFYVAKTIVTTDLLDAMAHAEGCLCINTLTGFKYIAQVMKKEQGRKRLLLGAEESCGYLIGEAIQDKDSLISAAALLRMLEALEEQGLHPLERLNQLYLKYGLYEEALHSITLEKKEGVDPVATIMHYWRNSQVESLAGERITARLDYLSLKKEDLVRQKTSSLAFPSSPVLQFYTATGAKITIRPSGTEPKLKFYFSLHAVLGKISLLKSTRKQLQERIVAISRTLQQEPFA